MVLYGDIYFKYRDSSLIHLYKAFRKPLISSSKPNDFRTKARSPIMGLKSLIKLIADADIKIGTFSGTGLGAVLLTIIVLCLIFSFSLSDLIVAYQALNN